MATSHTQLMNAISEEEIQPFWVSYFREHFRGLVHDQLLEAFEAWKRQGNNRAILAKRLGRRPEQVTRWLAAPSNCEIDTVSDIALAMGFLPIMSLESIRNQPSNHNGVQADQEFQDSPGIKARPTTGSSESPKVEVCAG